MDIILLVVGKTGISYIREGISEYCKRLSRYLPYQIVELPDHRKGRLSEAEQKEAEADMILKSISATDYVVLLDERGQIGRASCRERV